MKGSGAFSDRRVLRITNSLVGLGLLVRFALADPDALNATWLVAILALTGFGDLALSFMGRSSDRPSRAPHPNRPSTWKPPRSRSSPSSDAAQVAERDDDASPGVAKLLDIGPLIGGWCLGYRLSSRQARPRLV